jgi:hypothetical protein
MMTTGVSFLLEALSLVITQLLWFTFSLDLSGVFVNLPRGMVFGIRAQIRRSFPSGLRARLKLSLSCETVTVRLLAIPPEFSAGFSPGFPGDFQAIQRDLHKNLRAFSEHSPVAVILRAFSGGSFSVLILPGGSICVYLLVAEHLFCG